MPWHVIERNGEFCVIKDSDGSSAGCHVTREKANAQMRALYANEPSMKAGLEIDWEDLEWPEPQQQVQPMRIEVGTVTDREANDALLAALTALSDRLHAAEERQADIVACVQQIAVLMESDRTQLNASLEALTAAVLAQPVPVVNVPDFPEIPAPVVNVQPPEVNVTVEPPKARQIKIERDPITQQIASASWEDVE